MSYTIVGTCLDREGPAIVWKLVVVVFLWFVQWFCGFPLEFVNVVGLWLVCWNLRMSLALGLFRIEGVIVFYFALNQ
jgi:hypothetical protein